MLEQANGPSFHLPLASRVPNLTLKAQTFLVTHSCGLMRHMSSLAAITWASPPPNTGTPVLPATSQDRPCLLPCCPDSHPLNCPFASTSDPLASVFYLSGLLPSSVIPAVLQASPHLTGVVMLEYVAFQARKELSLCVLPSGRPRPIATDLREKD